MEVAKSCIQQDSFFQRHINVPSSRPSCGLLKCRSKLNKSFSIALHAQQSHTRVIEQEWILFFNLQSSLEVDQGHLKRIVEQF
jgi:hypothetical protein